LANLVVSVLSHASMLMSSSGLASKSEERSPWWLQALCALCAFLFHIRLLK
jgi:hypothetical protein